MKAKQWFNLIFVGLIAAGCTFFAYRWAVTTYAEPTCRRFVEAKGSTYIGFNPPDINARTGSSHMSRDGNCQFRTGNGDVQEVSLVAASGTNFGAPLIVSFALSWELTFLWSFLGVAFILAMVYRVLKIK